MSQQPTCQKNIQEVLRDRSRRRGRVYPGEHRMNKTLIVALKDRFMIEFPFINFFHCFTLI